MESGRPETATKQNSGSSIVFAGMAALYMLVCLCLGAVVFIYRQQIPGIKDYFPTATLLPTNTPIAHKPAPGDKVFKDDFSDNTHNWQAKWNSGKVSVKNGQLLFESIDVNSKSQCDLCSFAGSHFYIEADFATSKAVVDTDYGIIFNLKATSENPKTSYTNFYSFEIDAASHRYFLYKTDTQAPNGDWTLRLSNKSSLIQPYPHTNKLGVAFDKDAMELYINGTMVDSYQDPGTKTISGDFGFYADSPGFQLIVVSSLIKSYQSR